jgi:AhpD family alkylhydroperoxidase
MLRDKVHKEMKQLLGLVPSFFKTVPDDVLEQEWTLFKRIEMDDGPIPTKYRELMGVAIAGTTHCRYCSLFHTEMAKLNGASEQEIEFATRVAKNSAGWSTYLNGMQVDYDEFREELVKIGKHLRSVR